MTHSTSDPAFLPEPGDRPVAAGTPRPPKPKPTPPKPPVQSTKPETEALKEEIERTREELGDTVEALAAKADVKARAQETAAQVKASAQETAAQAKASAQDTADQVRTGAQQTAERLKISAQAGLATAQVKAVEYGDRAKQAVQDPENAGKVKGGGAAAAGTAALGVVVWAVRRRRDRRSRWEKTADATRQAFEQAVGYGEAALHSDQAAKAVDTGKRAARKAAKQAAKKGQELTPEATPRRKGTLLLVVGTAAGLVAYRFFQQNDEVA